MSTWIKLACIAIVAWFLADLGRNGSDQSAEPPVPNLSEAYAEVAVFIRSKAAAVRLAPSSATAWGEYAMALDAHEYRSDAIRCYETANELEPTNARWKYLLALCIKESDARRATSLLDELVSDGHNNVAAVIQLADILGQSGKPEELTELLDPQKTDSSSHPAIIVKIAENVFADGDMAKAEQLLNLLNDDFMESAKLKARLFAQRGDMTAANDELARATQLPSVMTTIHDAYSEAIANYRRDPLWLGKQAAERANRGDRIALMTLQALVRKHPRLIENRIQLSLLYQTVGDTDRGVRSIEEGLTLTPNDRRLLAARGTLALLDSEWAIAEDFLRQVIEQDAYQKSAWADLAYVLEQQQREAESIAAYQKAIKLNPQDADLKTRLLNLQRNGGGQSE
ncbi:MAG: tetratricopeptide repeat protein [Fuerstiella sp.]|nr:tetratricopeptide repeat protein [Fuerstiella sp.]